MTEGLKIARALSRTRALAGAFAEESLPGAAVTGDAALDAYVRETSDTIFHPVGTCSMGTDRLAVVDPCLRVYGVEALRVVDASIMPSITGGNTHAPAVMIAEKGADMIRAARPGSDQPGRADAGVLRKPL